MGHKHQTSADNDVRVLSLSDFCLDFPENPVRCLSAFRILSGFLKKAVRCRSVRPDKNETEVSGLSVSLTVDVCLLLPNQKCIS